MSGRPRAADVILGGGLVAGTLDIVNAIVFWRLYNGASAAVILQSVAAGLQGKAAFAGGAASAALGLFLHFLMMLAMAAVFWLGCRRWPALVETARPVRRRLRPPDLGRDELRGRAVVEGRRPAIHAGLVRRRDPGARPARRHGLRLRRAVVGTARKDVSLAGNHAMPSAESP